MTDEFIVDVSRVKKNGKVIAVKNRRIKFNYESIHFLSPKTDDDLWIVPCEKIQYKPMKSPTGKLLTILLWADDEKDDLNLKISFKTPHDQYMEWVVKNFNKMIEENKDKMQRSKATKKVFPSVGSRSSSSSANCEIPSLFNEKACQKELKRQFSKSSSTNSQSSNLSTLNPKMGLMTQMVASSDPFNPSSNNENHKRPSSAHDGTLLDAKFTPSSVSPPSDNGRKLEKPRSQVESKSDSKVTPSSVSPPSDNERKLEKPRSQIESKSDLKIRPSSVSPPSDNERKFEKPRSQVESKSDLKIKPSSVSPPSDNERKLEKPRSQVESKSDSLSLPIGAKRSPDTSYLKSFNISNEEARSYQTSSSYYRESSRQIFQNRRLVNTGNSCYFNATMQALASCPPFVSRCKQLHRLVDDWFYLFDKQKNQSEEMQRKYTVLENLLLMVWTLSDRIEHSEQGERPLSPLERSALSRNRRQIGKINRDFDNDDQQDAHEYLITLLGSVDDIMEARSKQEQLDMKREDLKAKLDVPERIVALLNPVDAAKFSVETSYVCQECEHTESRTDYRRDLSLPVSDGCSVQELLALFVKWSPMEKECPNCRNKVASTSERISKFPQCLIVNLKLYELNGLDFSTKKKDCTLKPSFQLDASFLGCSTPVEHHELDKSLNAKEQAASPLMTSPEPYLNESNTDQEDEKNKDDFSVKLLGGAFDIEQYSQSDDVIVEDVKEPREIDFKWLSDIEEIQDILHKLKLDVDCKTQAFRNHLHKLSETRERRMKQDDAPGDTRDIVADGNCFYRAISWCLTGSEAHHAVLRKATADHLNNHEKTLKKYCKEEDYTAYVINVTMDKEWASSCEIFAMANMLNVKIFTFLPKCGWTSHLPQNELSPLDGSIYLNNTQMHYEPVTSLKRLRTGRSLNKRKALDYDDDENKRNGRNTFGVEEEETESASFEDGRNSSRSIEKTDEQNNKLNDSASTDPALYTLVAVVCHLGDSPNKGHYVAYTKDLYKDDEWVYCSDENIHVVTEQVVSEALSSSGYILFYDRQ